jgi:hypothetical protein
MDTLRLVEVTGDGDLVLMTGDGRRFSLAVDEQLRSAVRRSRNGTQVPVDSERPGPREVQSRIRAGADAEQVAAQTGLDVDYVRRFEGPVLAERAHVADLARATAVDRGGDPTLTLERVVLDVLTGEGYDVDDIAWDSRRTDGTRWQVLVVSRAGTARTEATWSFDTATRSLEPVDAEAERLTGVERRRRLSAVRETVFDVERPSGAVARGGTVELLDALARQRGRRPVTTAPERSGGASPGPGARPDEAGSGAEEAPRGTDGVDRATDPATHDQEPAAASGLRVVAADGGQDAGRDGSRTEAGEVSIEPDLLSELDLDTPLPSRTRPDGEGGHRPVAGAGSSAAQARPQDQRPGPGRVQTLQAQAGHSPGQASGQTSGQNSGQTSGQAAGGERRGRRRRAAVPSWDEIVFGAKRDD